MSASDAEHYEFLCKTFGESMVMKDGAPDCDGQHADQLKKRFDEALQDYVALCVEWGERVRHRNGCVDCCGEHARQLEEHHRRLRSRTVPVH